MKSTRLIMAVSLAFVLTLLVVSMVAAAPAGSGRAAQAQAGIALDDPITPTVPPVLTATLPHTQPVALAISMFFNISYTEVISLHESGIGFGVIARAWLTAKALSGTLSFTEVLALKQSGEGWGQIAKQFGVHPGGKGLGSIMSGHANQTGLMPTGPGGSMGPGTGGNSSPMDGGAASCRGNSCNSPGHSKSGKGPKR